MWLGEAPMRISLAGGGSDLPIFQQTGQTGYILSFTIPYWMHVLIRRRTIRNSIIQYSDIEYIDNPADIQHILVHNALKLYSFRQFPYDIHIMSDLRARGTGLGGSSALTCALITALRMINAKSLDTDQILNDAIDVEINLARAPIGIQDTVASVYGGLCLMAIHQNALQRHQFLDASHLNNLIQAHCLLIAPPNQSRTHYIDQNDPSAIDVHSLYRSSQLALQYAARITDISFDQFCDLLHQVHHLKECNPINRSTNEQKYFLEILQAAGARAWKRCGAGNQGYYFVCAPDKTIFKYIMHQYYPECVILDLAIEFRGARAFAMRHHD
jgi:D-glycero-alpha-D-manno-heptose-7-phosphate kinase